MTELVINIPDLGGVEEASVIELSVKVGDVLKPNDTIMVLESEKASMEIPTNVGGVVQKIMVSVGDKVSSGTPVIMLSSKQSDTSDIQPTTNTELSTPMVSVAASAPTISENATATPLAKTAVKAINTKPALPIARNVVVHAGPAVRKLAREFGIDLHFVKPSGPKERIVKEDLHAYVKQIINSTARSSSFDVPVMPAINFEEFGEIETVDIGRIKKITAINMHRNWVRIPHVTQFDEADISSLEIFRKSEAVLEAAQKLDVKLTVLPFIIKAVAIALRKFPQFNASIEPDGQKVVLKKYCHIGFAVDTDEGLFVPVIRDADKKTILDLASSAKELSEKARAKTLLLNEMKGGCFTVSSLGSVGGTAFTPIINAPEVAILGVSRASIKPIYIEGKFEPRTMLPLSLSYDHRIIDGAEAAKFVAFIASLLANNELLT